MKSVSIGCSEKATNVFTKPLFKQAQNIDPFDEISTISIPLFQAFFSINADCSEFISCLKLQRVPQYIRLKMFVEAWFFPAPMKPEIKYRSIESDIFFALLVKNEILIRSLL